MLRSKFFALCVALIAAVILAVTALACTEWLWTSTVVAWWNLTPLAWYEIWIAAVFMAVLSGIVRVIGDLILATTRWIQTGKFTTKF